MTLKDLTLGTIWRAGKRGKELLDAPETNEVKIPKWKAYVREFRDEHGLTDRQAIDLVNMDLSNWSKDLEED